MVKPRTIINISEKIDALFAPMIKPIEKYGVSANHISLLQAPFVILFVTLHALRHRWNQLGLNLADTLAIRKYVQESRIFQMACATCKAVLWIA